uniref:Uncharacterized protein n=1 Tax=Arundo donax TaxID=35708 RepID=A0A0A9HKU3_ARUDO
MICFDMIAQRIIGKNVEALMRSVRRTEGTPPDLAAIICLKFGFNITITEQSFYKADKTYQINSITATFGRENAIPRLPTILHPGQSSNVREVDQNAEMLTPSKTLPLDQDTLQTPPPTLYINEAASQSDLLMDNKDTSDETETKKTVSDQ